MRRGTRRSYPIFEGMPSPALANMRRMGPGELKQYLEKLKVEQNRLGDKIGRMKQINTPELSAKLKRLQAQWSRMQALWNYGNTMLGPALPKAARPQ
jgi:hypothetical protein